MTATASTRCVTAFLLCVLGSALVAQEPDGGARVSSRALPAAVLGTWSPGMSREDVQLGRVDADHDDGYLYRLPYSLETSYPVIQAYDSRLSHRGAERFTLDFGMPIGTPVHAAREGTVVLVEDSHAVGCPREDCGRFANFVVILHDDGTTGEYFHLAPGSAAVRRGDVVRRGELLARSGNTGFSTTPHLHFGVYRTASDGRNESLAVRFATRAGAIGAPRSGARYLSPREP